MKNKVVELYENFDEENRLIRARESRVEALTTIRYLNEYINKTSKVLEIGCGTGFYGFEFAKKLKSYVGIDIAPRNIDVFNHKIEEMGLKNLKGEVGDALDLKQFKDETFDVVLLLGPLYHFGKESEKKSIMEATRVCKKGGIVALSYMSKFGNFVKMCVNENFVGRYPSEFLFESMIFNEIDDDNVFFFTTPEKIEKLTKSCGLSVLHHVATDGETMHHHRISDYRDEEFDLWLKYHFETCEEPSLLGTSDHGLIIARKK